MTAHVELPGIEPTPGLAATLSANVLQTLLRDKMGFKGLIMTDSLGMGALAQTYGVTQATVLAFQAGADILAFGADPGHTPAEQRPAYQQVLAFIQSGVIPQSRLDESVRRILLTKARYGLLDWPLTNLANIPQQVGTSEHLNNARRIAQESITLVRAEPGLLPLARNQSALVICLQGAENLAGALKAYSNNVQILQLSLNPLHDEISLASQNAAQRRWLLLGRSMRGAIQARSN